MRKRFLPVFMSACMVISLAGCSDGDNNNSNGEKNVNEKEAVKLSDVSQMANFEVNDIDSDDVPDWQKSSTQINLNGSEVEIHGNGAAYENSIITITKAGNYVLSGKLDNGKIVINAGEKDKVYLILNGVEITCSDDAVINEMKADKVILTAVEGTENTLSDGEKHTDENITAAIYCEDSITVNGTGKLTVQGSFKDGITSKDKFKLIDATLDIVSKDDGIIGKDVVAIKSGNLKIDAMGDGIKSTKTTNIEQGIVCVDGGTVTINSELDGIQAENFVKINGGEIHITTGGSSTNEGGSGEEMLNGEMPPNENGGDMPDGEMPTGANGPRREMPTDENGKVQRGDDPNGGKDRGGREKWGQKGEAGRGMEDSNQNKEDTPSAKGLKGGNGVYIKEGTISIDSSDDSIHSNDMVYILGGKMDLSSGDDGIHADTTLEISGGTIDIAKSYEGIEAYYITISGGDISLVSRDDGLNAAGGNDSSSVNGRPGQNEFREGSGDATITIKGGNLNVTASGDGIDSNGSITMTDGKVIVCGPENGGNGIFDYDKNFIMDGGTLLGAGSLGMFQSISSGSKLNVINATISGSKGDEIAVYDGDKKIADFTANTKYEAVIVSAPELEKEKSYTIKYGESETSWEAAEAIDYSGR